MHEGRRTKEEGRRTKDEGRFHPSSFILHPSLLCLIAIAYFSCIFVAFAESPEQLFYKANSLYGEGKYAEAIAEYDKVLQNGYESGNLYYNLGNAYMKAGDLGKAMLNYERARRIMPRDSDLESNYKFARSLAENNISEPDRIWYARFAEGVFGQYAVDEIAILLSIIYLFIIIALIAGIYTGMNRNVWIALSILVMVFSLASVSFAQKAKLVGREAVITADSTEAKFEPFDRATTHFTLYEGATVLLIQSKGEWQKVERADGKAGWVKSEAIEPI